MLTRRASPLPRARGQFRRRRPRVRGTQARRSTRRSFASSSTSRKSRSRARSRASVASNVFASIASNPTATASFAAPGRRINRCTRSSSRHVRSPRGVGSPGTSPTTSAKTDVSRSGSGTSITRYASSSWRSMRVPFSRSMAPKQRREESLGVRSECVEQRTCRTRLFVRVGEAVARRVHREIPG